jgi:beta-phosphoglucomutase
MLILKDHVYPEAKILEMMERKNNYYLEFIKAISPRDLLPGAKELLEEIRAAGLRIALGSASKNASEVLDRLGIRSLFDAISDGHSVERQKPAPDLFLHAAGQLGLAPDECVVIEDAAAGIEAARAGGFHSIGLGPRERVGAADANFPSLEGLQLAHVLHGIET